MINALSALLLALAALDLDTPTAAVHVAVAVDFATLAAWNDRGYSRGHYHGARDRLNCVDRPLASCSPEAAACGTNRSEQTVRKLKEKMNQTIIDLHLHP